MHYVSKSNINLFLSVMKAFRDEIQNQHDVDSEKNKVFQALGQDKGIGSISENKQKKRIL